MANSHFDSAIRKAAEKYGLPFHLIKAQIAIESGFNPNAVSKCGARGLMQIMPQTARHIQDSIFKNQNAAEPELFDPEINIDMGTAYDRWLYDRFPEIPVRDERFKFMLGAYNCGRGYINQALRLAREEEFGFQPLVLVAGKWQTWNYTCRHLASPLCFIELNRRRRYPDFNQVWRYVDKVWAKYQEHINFESATN